MSKLPKMWRHGLSPSFRVFTCFDPFMVVYYDREFWRIDNKGFEDFKYKTFDEIEFLLIGIYFSMESLNLESIDSAS